MSVVCAVLLFWGVFPAARGDVVGVHDNQNSGHPRARLPSLVRNSDSHTEPRADSGSFMAQPGPRAGPRADPSFMAQLFQHLAGEHGARKVGPAPYGATTIRFYRSQEAAVPFHLRHESGGLAMSFNVSSLQDTAVVTSAQLRVFRQAQTPSSCRLYVFRTSPDGAGVRQLVSRRLLAGSSGWEEFDITQWLSRHGRDGRVLQLVLKVKCRHGGNRTDLVGPRNDTHHPSLVGPRNDAHLPSVVGPNRNDTHHPSLVGPRTDTHHPSLVGPRNAPSLVGPRNDTHHPSLVLYIWDGEESNSSEPPASLPVTELPARRGVTSSAASRHTGSSVRSLPVPTGSPDTGASRPSSSAARQRRRAVLGKTVCHPSRAGNARPRRPCRRHSLYVDFEELGWDWIIAPAGYTAYYCRGQCPAIMGQHLRPTNHAVVQNILGLLRAKLPPARCVPDLLRPISVLHYEQNGSIVYKEYPDMVAMSCACR